MAKRLIRIALVLPLLTLLWGYSNAIGATQTFSQATGITVPTTFKIPYIDQKWANGQKSVPHPALIARDTIREAGRQGLDRQALDAAITGGKKVGLTAQQMKAEYEKGLAESEKKHENLLAATAQKPAQKPAQAAKKATVTSQQTRSRAAYKVVQSLPVKGRAPKTGYSRDQFGSAWTDAVNVQYGRNGCDTRNDILKRDLIKVSMSGRCKVLSGVLPYERYTGKQNVKFIASGPYANQLDAEHIVALGDAWQKGAQKLSKAKRTEFANDPANLFMADPSANRQKGDADAASWLPKNKSYRCTYVTHQSNVKKKYNLWVTQAEKNSMLSVLKPCL